MKLKNCNTFFFFVFDFNTLKFKRLIIFKKKFRNKKRTRLRTNLVVGQCLEKPRLNQTKRFWPFEYCQTNDKFNECVVCFYNTHSHDFSDTTTAAAAAAIAILIPTTVATATATKPIQIINRFLNLSSNQPSAYKQHQQLLPTFLLLFYFILTRIASRLLPGGFVALVYVFLALDCDDWLWRLLAQRQLNWMTD